MTLLIAGDLPGADPLETARRTVGESAPTGFVPLPDPREEQPWLLLRTAAILTDASIDLQPFGPRLLTGSTRLSQQQRDALRDHLETFALGWNLESPPAGTRVSVSLWGPMTLSARLFGQWGERLLADRGAVRFLSESLADGAARLAESALRDHGLTLEFTLIEDLLEDAMDGLVPTASGLHTHRRLSLEDLRGVYGTWAEAQEGRRGTEGEDRDAVVGLRKPELGREAAARGRIARVGLRPQGARWDAPSAEQAAGVIEDGRQVLAEVRGAAPAETRSQARAVLEAVERCGFDASERRHWGLWVPEGLRGLGEPAWGALADLRSAEQELTEREL